MRATATQTDGARMLRIPRRTILAGAAAAGGALIASRSNAAERAGNFPPHDPALAALNPDAEKPPGTDHGDLPGFKYSFSVANKRIEEGGWARQVTVKEFPIAETIAGVNMSLAPGGIRELHWHLP